MPGWLMDHAEFMKKNTQFLMDIFEKQVSAATLSEALHPAPVTPGRKDTLAREEYFVRVLSENLNRMLGLAGENLVQAKSAKPFFSSLVMMKNSHTDLVGTWESLLNAQESALPPEVRVTVDESLNKLEKIRDFLIQNIDDYENFLRRLEYLAEQLYNEVVSSRMRPFSDGLQGFSRLVRDLAQKFGKKVNFIVNGASTRVDRDVLEKLKAPLTHLLQNAIDHGLETMEDRVAQGKPAEGTIVLEARHVSGMLNISLSDDGKGIDPELIRRKVVERGLSIESIAENMSKAELYEFLFLPGFSTAQTITEVSGRGVGLDVVFSMLREVGGSGRVESEPGTGTTFHLQLPLTLSVLRTLMVEINGDPYALSLNRIDRVISVSPKDLQSIEDRQFCTIENEHIGVINAQQILHLPPSTHPCTEVTIAIISDRLTRYGLVVDRIIDERELVVRPLDPRLGKIPNISSGAIMEDGLPVLIMDVDDLVRSIDNLLTRGKLSKVGSKKKAVRSAQKRILVVDDSLTVRQVERKILENSGYEVTLAVDGMDGWNVLQGEQFDLIISDVDMPRMNGIELVRKIKSAPNFKDLPVMIISYKDREEDKLLGLEAGANYYLTKASFHDESLVNAVRDLIGEASR
jgi:two-component system sensor histidine kinase and response regulator WspE